MCSPTLAGVSMNELKCEHYKSIRDIFLETFDETELKGLGQAWRNRTKEKCLGAFTKEGDLLGFVITTDHYVDYLAVHPLYQQYKIGTSMLQTVLAKCRDDGDYLYLDHPVGQTHVRDWYIRNGFYQTPLKGRMGLTYHSYMTRSRKHLWKI